MSHLLHRRRGHDSEDDDDEESIVSGMSTTTDYDQGEEDNTGDEENSQEEETDSEYDSSEQENDKESEQEVSKDVVEQPTVETKSKEIQATSTANQTTQVNDQPTPPATTQTTEIGYQDLQQQKTVQELREYRRKLAEDPSFVPYVGLFWGHDDRYREDSFAGGSEATRESLPRFSHHHITNNSSIKKPSYDRNLDPLMHKKWDHSGYEELLRLDEQDERRRRELIESGQSPSQVHHRPPQRLPRYHHYNGRGGGGGVGSIRGRGHRGGYHHPQQQQQHRFSNVQKRPFTRQQEEWPHLSTSTASASTSGNMADQSLSDNKALEPKLDAWGSVDRAEEVRPMVKSDSTADGLGSSTNAKATDGWGSVSMEAPKIEAEKASTDTDKENQKKGIPATTAQTESGWGTLPETSENDAWKAPFIAETKKQPEFSSSTSPQDNWNTQPAATTESSTGWGEPAATTCHVAGWDTVTENKDLPTGSNSTEPTNHVETTTVQKTNRQGVNTKDASPFITTTTDGWGKPEEASVQNSWSNSKSKDWNTPQKDTTANSSSSNNNNDHSRGWIKPTPSAPQGEQTVIPPEEKASSSWANIKPDVEVHTTPSDFSKIYYNSNNKRHDPSRRNISSNYHQHQQQEEDYKSKATFDTSSMQHQQQNWSRKTSHSSNNWADTTTTTTTTTTTNAGWNATENVNTDTNVQSGWTAEASALSKSEETTKVDASWGSKSVKTTSSWNAPEASTKSYTKSTNWNDPATTFDQSNSSSSSSVRGGRWSKSRSGDSANWNADREWNNKICIEQQQQSKKDGDYYAGKTANTDAPETASTTEGFNTPETSAWGNFQSTGDDDSDVEIILEAEEEPEWSKEDEQVLGMTAPGDPQQPQYSPPSNRMTRSYLSQQHDSGQSSPHPEYSRKPANNGRHDNKPPHRSHFDDNWRQPREDVDTYRPMYYATPAHPPSQMSGNITYVPMIPNGSGSPIYAMPFPMGASASSSNIARGGGGGRSASPSHEPPTSSTTTTSPHKFYTPSPPNVQQLPPGYEANGMVYYGVDPSAMYPPPQPFYYYAPPHMMSNNNNNNNNNNSSSSSDAYDPMRPSLSPLHHSREDEDGWGPTPETVETEEQWATTTATNKSLQNDFQNRKQPVNNYYYPQQSHHY